ITRKVVLSQNDNSKNHCLISSDDAVKPVPFTRRCHTGEGSSSSDSSHRKRTKFLYHFNCEVEAEGECDESDVAKVDQGVKMDLTEDLLQICLEKMSYLGIGVSPGIVPVYHSTNLKLLDKRIKIAELVLRFMILGLGLVAAVLIGTDSQVKVFFSFKKEAKFIDVKALV
ncbi:hypothetical protein S83_023122, partial [Arachis hypogaea]